MGFLVVDSYHLSNILLRDLAEGRIHNPSLLRYWGTPKRIKRIKNKEEIKMKKKVAFYLSDEEYQ